MPLVLLASTPPPPPPHVKVPNLTIPAKPLLCAVTYSQVPGLVDIWGDVAQPSCALSCSCPALELWKHLSSQDTWEVPWLSEADFLYGAELEAHVSQKWRLKATLCSEFWDSLSQASSQGAEKSQALRAHTSFPSCSGLFHAPHLTEQP